MTEPSQYFKGRTVQEQMNEVIGYVDVRAEEVAAAKADDVLEPAEQAKDAAQAAQAAAETAKAGAEAARDTTLAALPAVNERINDVESDLNAVTLRVTTAEGDIVTIQGRITAVETKNNQQDTAIAALQTADEQNIKLTGERAIGNYAVLLTGNQGPITGLKKFTTELNANLQKNSYCGSGGNDINKWFKVCEMPSDMLRFHGMISTNSGFIFFTGTNGSVATKSFGVNATMKLVKNNDGTFTLWNKMLNAYTYYYSVNINAFRYSGQRYIDIETDGLAYDTPTAGEAEYDNTVIQ